MKDNFKKSQIIMLPTDQKSEVGDFTLIKVDPYNYLMCGIKKCEPYNLTETRQEVIDLIRRYDAYLTKLDSGYLKSAVVDKWIENNIL